MRNFFTEVLSRVFVHLKEAGFVLVTILVMQVSAHAEWKEYKTTKGCLFYEWIDSQGGSWDWDSIEWSENCAMGKPIQGRGTVTLRASSAEWWITQSGNFVNGVPHGAIKGTTAQFPDKNEAVTYSYLNGCWEQATDCLPRSK